MARKGRRKANLSSMKDALGEVNSRRTNAEDDDLNFSGFCLSTGSLMLDIALSGGIGEGKVLNLMGPEKSGKTTIEYETILFAYYHYEIEPVIYDHEGSFDFDYMQRIADQKYPGLRVEEFVRQTDSEEFGPQNYFCPDYGEWTFDHISDMLNARKRVKKEHRKAILFVIDSVAAMVPKASMDTEEVTVSEDGTTSVKTDKGNKAMGAHARMMSIGFPKIKTRIKKSGCFLMVTNQLRFKIGVMFGSPETEPGGNAMFHYVDQRVKMQPCTPADRLKFGTTKVKGTGGISGVCREDHVSGEGWDKLVYSKGTITKNKIGPPLRNFDIRMIISEQGGPACGIDVIADTAVYLMATGQMEKRAGFYYLRLLGVDEESGEPNRDKVLIDTGRTSWADMKKLIGRPGLEETVCGIEIYAEESEEVEGPIDIRAHCYAQIESGAAAVLYAEALSEGNMGGSRLWAEVIEPVIEKVGRKQMVTGLLVEYEDGEQVTMPLPDITQKKSDEWRRSPDKIIGKRVKVLERMAQAVEHEPEEEVEEKPKKSRSKDKKTEKPKRASKSSSESKKGTTKKKGRINKAELARRLREKKAV